MPTQNVDALRKRLETEILKIDGDVQLLPEINISNQDAKPFIEVERYGYTYVCQERGNEIFRKIPYDIDALVFEIFKDVTSIMAGEWELNNRKKNEDSRRQLFGRQLELMTRISTAFGAKLKSELDQILKYAPFTD